MTFAPALKTGGLITALLSALLSVTSAQADTPALPAALTPPSGQLAYLKLQAAGVQIYECQASKEDSTRYSWVFKSPEAELFDESGRSVGKHYAGPTWESVDGSKVLAEVKAKDAGPEATAIPWLLLTAKSNSGQGLFAPAQSILRIHTRGGKAPTDGCSAAQMGQVARVFYQADYLFNTSKR